MVDVLPFPSQEPPSDEHALRTLSANLRFLSSVMGARQQFASAAGVTFDGSRDMYTALGYKRVLLPLDFRARFNRDGVAARIVEAYPKSTWRHGGELIEDDDPNNVTPFEQAWQDLNQRLQIWGTFQQADILCGIGRYSVIIIGGPGNLDTPLERMKLEELLYLQPYSEQDVRVAEYETDTKNSRFSYPTKYELRRGNIANTIVQPPTVTTGKQIHWTRILHISDNILDDMVFGAPRMERVWNLLDDLMKVVGGGAEAYWKRADAGMQLKLDPMIKKDDPSLADIKQQVQDYIDGLRRVLTTRGVDINPLSSNVADFSSPVDALLKLLSTALGIPQRILTGSERGELASNQDKGTWEENVSDRRSYFANARVVRPFVDRLIKMGTLPIPETYEARWPEKKNLDDIQLAQVALMWAQINSSYGGTVTTADEIRDILLDLPPLDEVLPEAPTAPDQIPLQAQIPPPTAPPEVIMAARRALKRRVMSKSALVQRIMRAQLRWNAVVKMRGLGGPGSGNWGHAGRPGEVGGSAEGG